MTAPLIVDALLGPADQSLLDALRRAHFPPGRNRLPAHLTLFHHLPPSIERELIGRLVEEARAEARPAARLASVRLLGGGVAFAVESPALAAIRERLAEAFAGVLTPQDQARWWPHVTIQNKVERSTALALADALAPTFRPTPLHVAGLGLWRYRGGPWEMVRRFPFRG